MTGLFFSLMFLQMSVLPVWFYRIVTLPFNDAQNLFMAPRQLMPVDSFMDVFYLLTAADH